MIGRGTLAAQIAVVLALSSAPVAAQTTTEGMSSLDSLVSIPIQTATKYEQTQRAAPASTVVVTSRRDRAVRVPNSWRAAGELTRVSTRLTQQLLAFSRKQVLQTSVLSLNSVVHDIEQMLGRLIGEAPKKSPLSLWGFSEARQATFLPV